MLYTKSDNYDKFKCIADKCPKTCCQGWQIVIDEDTLERYKNEKGSLSENLSLNVDWDNKIFKEIDGHCGMLRDDGLCMLQYELGEEALCRTCAMYPRHIEEYEDVREYSLSLSCPEAARIIIENKNKLGFIDWEDALAEEDDEEFEEFDHFLYSLLLSVREKAYEIAQNRELCFEDKMAYLGGMAILVQECVDDDRLFDIEEVISRYDLSDTAVISDEAQICEGFSDKRAFSVMFELEQLSPEWINVVDTTWKNWEKAFEIKEGELILNLSKDEEIIAEQILMFFLYTYLCGAVYDDFIHTKIMLAIYSVYWIFIIYRTNTFKGGIIEAAYLYAREVEHSDENIIALEEWFDSLI